MSMSESNREIDDTWDEGEDDQADSAEDADEGELAEAAQDGEPEAADDGGKKRRRRRRKPDEDEYLAADDERAQHALAFVTDIIDKMEMECRVRLRRPKEDDEDPEIHIEITGPDAGRIIGKKGQVLAALQFLTHRVVNRPSLDKRHVLVDAEGYRSRRDNSLATMAQRLGKQAVEQGKIITFEPMNPRDRRVVHLALAKFEGVITKSDGEGDDRRVQIIPVRR
jgi:spoIIIJ-associated protein